ncbi:response regulator transcription factor [Ruegeria marisrubri]|uniref:response regulator transcription factor n=1 Tax=Ruegeria marisrubri TaxID=1685379 RepID=UPI001CD42233|nr:response regulator transcription factor [Ruegeria marisrubri]MCA0907031.1 response regulator transcription factor [Ruegeria marisrubri]
MVSRLLIIDDDPRITSALVRGLSLHGYAAEAENRADQGLERLKSGVFSGAIVDVMLGTDSGIELVRAARLAGVGIPILMLSALSDVDHRAAGLEAGADDYVVKPFSFDELVARLQVQEQRVLSQRPDPARLSSRDRTLSIRETRIALTEREFELLTLLNSKAGSPISRGELFDTLWSQDGSSNENVVDVYIGYLRKKLGSDDFGFEIKTIRNQGFCIQGVAPLSDDA